MTEGLEYERFRSRSLVVEEDYVTKLDDVTATTSVQKLQRTARTVIAANSLKALLSDKGDPVPNEAERPNIADLPREHPRNAGRYTVVAFVNSNSGGGMGKLIFEDLVRHLGAEYVFDLSKCRSGNMPEDQLRLC